MQKNLQLRSNVPGSDALMA